ncbi:ImmA/IrrE family metallo-endopeptidase [Actinoplanes sp. TBRC 11911]|uniref:XRE family transcriptional regulator n=1 Tax=Actinoplanes sp. TBRC 11911 TaxID=2729386 RepID=UPI00145ECD9B|nr:XRE family transcriptional regulator [Actinoplanes sp. TBRC 11911]NMO50325.1 ImmA/IrrE family metallo-endopeptidase [Actinoplanes sp. TBRC 11911]
MPVTPDMLRSRIRSAMSVRGVSQQALARAIGLDATALSKALNGARNFKSLEVALIAEHLELSASDLLSDSPAPPVAVAARAQPDASPALQAALARVNFLLELHRLLTDLGFDWHATVLDDPLRSGTAHDQGVALAERVRRAMGIGDNDLPYQLSDLCDLLERSFGLDIGFEPLPDGLDGLSVASDGLAAALVSSGISATRQRFTIAHELGHLMAGDSQDLLVDEDVFGTKSRAETRANAFAAAFLMPERAVRTAVPHGVSEEIVAALLGRFGVSLDALAFRLHNVGVVNSAGRDRIRSLSSNRIALRSGRVADLQARNDRRAPGTLLGRTIEAYVQAKVSVRPLADLLQIHPDVLLDELTPPSGRTTPQDDSEGYAL